MKLGLNLGYWGMGNDADSLVLAQEADRLGYAVAWAAEAYGSDAVTVLTWVAAQTTNIDIGSAVLQIPARTPAMTAMTAATLDTLSNGRFRLGLGVSGPQVSEGWHGVRFAKPLARTREYVDIVNLALSRKRVRYDGEYFQLPLPDGPGKALFLTVHPVREHVPIYLASVGPKNLELTGEIADGWLSMHVTPDLLAGHLKQLEAGTTLRSDGKTLKDLEVIGVANSVLTTDVKSALAAMKPQVALYVGGMGAKDKNFHKDAMVARGYGEAADRIQELYLAGRKEEAAAAVPDDYVDDGALVGPADRIAERFGRWRDAGFTTLRLINAEIPAMEALAKAL